MSNIRKTALNFACELDRLSGELTECAHSNLTAEDMLLCLDGAVELLSEIQAKYGHSHHELFKKERV